MPTTNSTQATELSYAYYPVGGYYGRHLDVPSTLYYRLGRSGQYREKREYSFLIYLNDDDWCRDDGGVLRLHVDPVVDVLPTRGTLAIFRSDSVQHEVLESRRPRLAVVGWFRISCQDTLFEPMLAAGARLERRGFDAAAAEVYLRLASEPGLDTSRKAYAWLRRAHALFDGCGCVEESAHAYAAALRLEDSTPAQHGLALCQGELPHALDHYATEAREWLENEHHTFGALGLGTRRILEVAAQHAPSRGAVLEFGVYYGRSLKMLQDFMPDRPLHGFDSFQGLPEEWMPGEPRGAYSTDGFIPSHIDGATFHVGWFEHTLPTFLRQHPHLDVALVHLDCDLYSSTKTVLDHLGPVLRPGVVLVFDDFLSYPDWRRHQKRAFDDACAKFGWAVSILAADIFTKQFAIKIDGQ